jgi:hypothetical protein
LAVAFIGASLVTEHGVRSVLIASALGLLFVTLAVRHKAAPVAGLFGAPQQTC